MPKCRNPNKCQIQYLSAGKEHPSHYQAPVLSTYVFSVDYEAETENCVPLYFPEMNLELDNLSSCGIGKYVQLLWNIPSGERNSGLPWCLSRCVEEKEASFPAPANPTLKYLWPHQTRPVLFPRHWGKNPKLLIQVKNVSSFSYR